MSSPRLTRWQRVALRLSELIPRMHLQAQVRRFADRTGRRRWILAVSGGADSMALALLVWAHWPQRRNRLVLTHFNHRLRGRASAADARFCRSVAKGLGITFEEGQWTQAPAQASEALARAARQDFLESVRRKHRAETIWTGHQRDDVAETMLMRLARGSGTAGLAAPRPVQSHAGRGTRLRPLLNLGRAEIVDALRRAKASWREDESNLTGAHFRNRVRQEVIAPWLKAAGRDAVAGAARSRDRLAEDDAALEAWVDEIAPIQADGSMALRRLAGKPPAVWRRSLHRWLLWQDDTGDLSRQGFENLLELVQAGQTSRFSLGKTRFARIRLGKLYME